MKKYFIVYILLLFLFLVCYAKTDLTNNKERIKVYIWENGITVPMECIEKCQSSQYKQKIVLNSTSKTMIFPEECKEICFGKKNQFQQTSKEEVKEKAQETLKEEKLRNITIPDKGKSQMIQEIQEKKKEIQKELKEEEVKEKAQEIKIRNRLIKIKLKMNQNGSTEIEDGRFRLFLENVSLVNNSILINNYSILLPSEIEVNFTKTNQKVVDLKLIQNNNLIKYQIKLNRESKVLGLIPIQYQEDLEIDAINGKEKVISSPWWKIFVFN